MAGSGVREGGREGEERRGEKRRRQKEKEFSNRQDGLRKWPEKSLPTPMQTDAVKITLVRCKQQVIWSGQLGISQSSVEMKFRGNCQ